MHCPSVQPVDKQRLSVLRQLLQLSWHPARSLPCTNPVIPTKCYAMTMYIPIPSYLPGKLLMNCLPSRISWFEDWQSLASRKRQLKAKWFLSPRSAHKRDDNVPCNKFFWIDPESFPYSIFFKDGKSKVFIKSLRLTIYTLGIAGKGQSKLPIRLAFVGP